jgi:hypothetical protein
MTADELRSSIDALPAIDLLALESSASLLTRRDRKYVLPADAAGRIVAGLAGHARVLEIEGRRWFGYRSTYFDTPSLTSYLGAARSRRRRFKVRTRTYLDAARSVLETKTRDPRGRTLKVRHDHPLPAGDRLLADDLEHLLQDALIAPHATELEPVLTTRYERATLVLEGVRVTLDRDLRASLDEGGDVRLPDRVVVETKSPGPPSEVDRLLWSKGYRPLRLSKFCTSLAVLRPELPGNRWSRAMRLPWHVSGTGARRPGGQSPPSTGRLTPVGRVLDPEAAWRDARLAAW